MKKTVLKFNNGTKVELNFFYMDGNDMHTVFAEKTLVEASQILAGADLSKITVDIGDKEMGPYDGYTTIVLLHPQADGVRVGLRRE